MRRFPGHPRPEGYVEGTMMTPAQAREWVLSMPEDMQLEFFEAALEAQSAFLHCTLTDHEGQISQLHRSATAAGETLRRLQEDMREVYSTWTPPSPT